MAVTVGGTSITFNDGTVQSTAAGAVTTTSVLNATAAASVGAVGTYAMLYVLVGGNGVPGQTLPGSSCAYSIASQWQTSCGTWYTVGTGNSPPYSSVPTGTWRSMGRGITNGVGLFLRIS